MTRVSVVERNPVLRRGMAALLQEAPGIRMVDDDPEVVVVGVTEPAQTRELTKFAGVRVVVLTALERPSEYVALLSAGALGCLVYGHFDAAELAAAITAAARGQAFLSPPVMTALVGWLQAGTTSTPKRTRDFAHELTPREAEIMELVAGGLSNRGIAARLFISEKTVKNHVHQIYRRLKADGREHAVRRWQEIAAPAGD